MDDDDKEPSELGKRLIEVFKLVIVWFLFLQIQGFVFGAIVSYITASTSTEALECHWPNDFVSLLIPASYPGCLAGQWMERPF